MALGFRRLLQWRHENALAAYSFACVVFVALLYLIFCYAEPQPVLMTLMGEMAGTAKHATVQVNGAPRLPAKYRMLNPVLYLVEYPLCRFVTYSLAWKDLPFMSANLISICHPICAFIGAYYMVSAALPPRKSDAGDPGVGGGCNTRYFRIAALLFQLRNTLDALDGVMARAQREGKPPPATKPGFNGAMLDVVTDMIGVFVFLCSMWYHFYLRRVPLSSHELPGIKQLVARMRDWGMAPLTISRVLIAAGIGMVCIGGGTWETYMLRFQLYFDKTTDAELLALERGPMVQSCYFFWAMTCGDTQFTYIIIATLTGVIFDWFIVLGVYGWTWLALLNLYSSYVTLSLQAHPLLKGVKLI